MSIDEIWLRHHRIDRLISLDAKCVLGPMDGDACHADRRTLLTALEDIKTAFQAMRDGGENSRSNLYRVLAAKFPDKSSAEPT